MKNLFAVLIFLSAAFAFATNESPFEFVGDANPLSDNDEMLKRATNADKLKSDYKAYKERVDRQINSENLLQKKEEDERSKRDEQFKLPDGAFRDENDYYENMGLFSQKTLKEMGEQGDKDALLRYGESLITYLRRNPNNKKLDRGINIPEGVKILEVFAKEGNCEAADTLWRLYKGDYKISANGDFRFSSDDKEEDYAPGEYARLKALYEEYENPELADKYSDMLAGLGDEFHLRFAVMRLVEKGKAREAAEMFDKYASKKEWFGNYIAYPIIADALGYAPMEAISCGCLCYGYHFAPVWGVAPKIKDADTAFKYAKVLEKNGSYGDDALIVAHMYLYGIGVQKDEQKAFENAQKAAMNVSYVSRSIPGNAYLAYAYEHGVGVEKDSEMSGFYWKLFYKPLPKDHVSAQAIVDTAKRFYNGFGMPKDKKLAIEILEKSFAICNAATDKYGHQNASFFAYALVNIYSGKYDEADKDPEKAAFYADWVAKEKIEITRG